MGWSYNFWKGTFYPADLNASKFLAYYSKQFDTVEVDSTFYRIPRTETLTEWKEQTPKDFIFSLKFPRIITHIKMLKNCERETEVFLEHANLLQEKLGPLLLQFPPTFKQEQLLSLEDYLKNLPKNCRYAVEVRNKSLLTPKFFAILEDNKAAYAWIESPAMPLSEKKTSNFVYVRLEGDRKKVLGTTGKTEIDKSSTTQAWAGKLKKETDEGTEVFVYFSKYYSGNPISDATEILNVIKNVEQQTL
jgi:uncharacterized protein YecE (DUF72 family)